MLRDHGFGVRTHDWCQNPHDYDKTTKDVESCPKRDDEWRPNVCNLRPVKGHRKQAEPRRDSEL
jgi:hypothetical protein